MKRAIFFIAILYLGCSVKQPTDVETSQKTGAIFVSSGQVSAHIFLDGEMTDKMTPDTLFDVSVGSHLIAVHRDGYRAEPDSVVVEVKENQVVQAKFSMVALSNTGFVFLESIPENAPIYMDGNPTGQVTPDTLTLEIGEHQIALKKNGYLISSHDVTIDPNGWISLHDTLTIEQRILLEGFANVSCPPCVAAANNLHQFNEETHSMPFVILEYYVYWPNQNDPFYLVSPNQINERINYYSIYGVPALRIDGYLSPYPGNYNEIIDGFSNATTSHTSPYGISIERKLSENKLHVSVEVYSFAGDFSNQREKLFVAILENNIHFDKPPGSNGLKDFSFVFRKFLSSAKGDELPLNTNLAKFNYDFVWPDWKYENCNVVCFIQNLATKKIVQTGVN